MIEKTETEGGRKTRRPDALVARVRVPSSHFLSISAMVAVVSAHTDIYLSKAAVAKQNHINHFWHTHTGAGFAGGGCAKPLCLQKGFRWCLARRDPFLSHCLSVCVCVCVCMCQSNLLYCGKLNQINLPISNHRRCRHHLLLFDLISQNWSKVCVESLREKSRL